MKAKIAFVILLLLISSINIYSAELPKNDLTRLRLLLFSSTENEDSLDSLFAFISVLDIKYEANNNPLLLAYSGVGKALLAKYTFFPWDKFRYVNEGFKLMDKAVELEKNDLEIRFLRFSVLSNMPSFLGYSSTANAEANVLYEMLKKYNYNEDSELIKNVVKFLIESDRLDKNKQEDLIQSFNVAIR